MDSPSSIHMREDGSVCVGDSNIPIEQVAAEFQRTHDVQSVIQRFPALSAAAVEEAVRYQLHNPDDAAAPWLQPEQPQRRTDL